MKNCNTRKRILAIKKLLREADRRMEWDKTVSLYDYDALLEELEELESFPDEDVVRGLVPQKRASSNSLTSRLSFGGSHESDR